MSNIVQRSGNKERTECVTTSFTKVLSYCGEITSGQIIVRDGEKGKGRKNRYTCLLKRRHRSARARQGGEKLGIEIENAQLLGLDLRKVCLTQSPQRRKENPLNREATKKRRNMRSLVLSSGAMGYIAKIRAIGNCTSLPAIRVLGFLVCVSPVKIQKTGP